MGKIFSYVYNIYIPVHSVAAMKLSSKFHAKVSRIPDQV